MVSDPVLIRFRAEQSERTKLHNLISFAFSTLLMDDSERRAIRKFDLNERSFFIETVDSKGKSLVFKGFIDQPGMMQCLNNVTGGSEVYVCFGSHRNAVSERTDSKVICPESRFNDFQGNYEISLYPFPYHLNMPEYEKYLIFKSILGTKKTLSREKITDTVYGKIRRMSIGIYGDELYSAVMEDVRQGIECGILAGENREYSIRADILTSSRSFLNFYYKYYEKLYKTTLYDF